MDNLPVKKGSLDLSDADALNEISDFRRESAEENLGNVTSTQLPQIKIAAGSICMFILPDASKVDELTGVIIDIWNANAWWEKGMDEGGGGEIPDCFSLDAITPSDDGANVQSLDCRSCTRNAWKPGGQGKECKNMKRILIVLPERTIPYLLSAPPTSIRPIEQYMISLTDKQLPFYCVNTKLTLVIDKNKSGIEYSKLHLVATNLIAGAAELRNSVTEMRKKSKEFQQMARKTKIEHKTETAGSSEVKHQYDMNAHEAPIKQEESTRIYDNQGCSDEDLPF